MSYKIAQTELTLRLLCSSLKQYAIIVAGPFGTFMVLDSSKKCVKMALEHFSEYPSPQTKNGVHFLPPLYVLIATNFAVATCFSEFAFYRRFSHF